MSHVQVFVLANLLILSSRAIVRVAVVLSLVSFWFRVGHLILRALAIQASNPQNALARISFYSPKSLPPPPHHDHAVATASQLAILPKTSSTCSSHTHLHHGQLFRFFSIFSSSTTFGTPEIHFHILARNPFTFSNLPEQHALIKNNSLATLSNTW